MTQMECRIAGKWKPYPRYKDSGVEWLGEIPEHWSTERLGWHVDLLTGFPFKSDLFSINEGIRLVRGDNVTEGQLRWGDKTRCWSQPTDELEAFFLRAGDLLIGMDGSKVGKNYAVATNEDLPLLLVQRVARLRVDKELENRFLQFLIGSDLFRIWVELTKTDPAIPHISPKDIRSFPIPLPRVPEQCAIATFLDLKMEKIDALIAKKERLIELLQEKRAAIISHAVTKGLDPNMPTKDSGVEWLGDIPVHWKVERIKWVAKMESGHTPDKQVPEYWENCNIPWISLNDTNHLREHDYIDDTAYHINELGLANSSARLLPSRAVVFTRDATIGLCAITTRPMAVSQHIIAWICGPQILPEYLLQVFRAMDQELEKLTMGSTIKTIGMTDVKKLITIRPPLSEQEQIANFIKQSYIKIDNLMEQMKYSIIKLKEYRASLIYATVTGKIDVREEVPAGGVL